LRLPCLKHDVSKPNLILRLQSELHPLGLPPWQLDGQTVPPNSRRSIVCRMLAALTKVVFARFALTVASGGSEGIGHRHLCPIFERPRRFDEVEDGDFLGDRCGRSDRLRLGLKLSLLRLSPASHHEKQEH
jgi:hypothetical protein